MIIEAGSGLQHEFLALLNTVRERLERYVIYPDEESIHDVRTAIRRLRMSYSALPESSRTDSSNHYVQTCRSLFRQNSEIRDCDVIKEKLLIHGLEQDDKLMQRLAARREELLKEALRQAGSLAQLQQPRLGLRTTECRERYVEQIEKHKTRFLSMLPLLITTESDIDAIHMMRKEAKNLFYLLELDPRLAELKRMIHLKRFQRIAGDLHDCDVAIGFLLKNKATKNSYRKLLKAEEATRHTLYLDLCDLMYSIDWERILDLNGGSLVQSE